MITQYSDFDIEIETGADGAMVGRLTAGDSSAQLLLPEDLDESQATTVLAYWPAWLLTEAARLELGSRVLVFGDGWLARSVLRLCYLRGCLHRTLCGSEELADEAEQRFAKLTALTTPPDAIFILADAARHLPDTLPLCANKGTIIVHDATPDKVDLGLYPDAHKRGLHITAVSPIRAGMEASQQDYLGLLARLVQQGKLKEPVRS